MEGERGRSVFAVVNLAVVVVVRRRGCSGEEVLGKEGEEMGFSGGTGWMGLEGSRGEKINYTYTQK